MTFLLETLRLGLANLMLHKLRSLLTALGIIIGVGAVVAIAAYGEGSKQAALADIKELGANNIILRSVRPPDSTEQESDEEEGFFGSEDNGPTITPYGLTRLDLRRLDTDSIQPVDEMVPLKRVGDFVYKGGYTAQAAMVFGGLMGTTSGVTAGLAATDPKLVPYGAMTATFYTGIGCLLVPSVLFLLVRGMLL